MKYGEAGSGVAAEKAATTPGRVMDSPDYSGLAGARAEEQQLPIHLGALGPAVSPPPLASPALPGAESSLLHGASAPIPKACCLCPLLGPSRQPVVQKRQGLFADEGREPLRGEETCRVSGCAGPRTFRFSNVTLFHCPALLG